MPGDTKIKQNSFGQWFDVDNPSVTHKTRREARAARRGSLPSQIASVPRQITSTAASATNTTLTLTVPPKTPSLAYPTLSSLQNRLIDRLTSRQGVSLAEALWVVVNNGYNKAASYGHMREAGATHTEAVSVIDRGDPDLSYAYGLARAGGFDHDEAIIIAEEDVYGDD